LEKSNRRDIKIAGSGSSGGGIYNNVIISGSGKINDDLDCVCFKSSGSSKIFGNLKANSIKISGSAQIEGNVEVEDIRISGSSHLLGDVKSQSMRINGSTHIGGSLYAEEVTIQGSARIDKNCEAESFKASGSFKIQGLLNAVQVIIKLGGNCAAKEIGGEHIEVKLNIFDNSFVKKVIDKIFNTRGELTTELIEGDEIYIQNTNAKIVRGNNITIGEGCNIGLIEYKGELIISDESIVKDKKKI
jgi:cytoskeletal protein CcmA (bactofilin family)